MGGYLGCMFFGIRSGGGGIPGSCLFTRRKYEMIGEHEVDVIRKLYLASHVG